MKIAPSILSADFKKLGEEVLSVSSADMLHLDIMDGMFVKNISFGPDVIKSIREISNIPFDTHLMINEPIRYIKEFVNAGSDYITVHYEACSNLDETLNEIKKYNVKCGISIKPNTPVSKIIDYLDRVDLILVMSVEPGFGGQSFMDSAISKVDYLKELKEKNNYNYIISVDGGINNETVKKVKNADMVVAGSYVFKKANRKEAIDSLR